MKNERVPDNRSTPDDSKVRGRMVELEVERRSTTLDGASPVVYYPGTTMEVDGVGVCVCHARGHVPTPEEVRQYLIGTQTEKILIEVKSDPMREEDPANVAINTFFRTYPETRVGTRSAALQLSTRHGVEPVIYPYCDRMHRSPADGDLICGPPVPESPYNGEWGGCVLASCEPPPDCPIVKWEQDEADRKKRQQRIDKLIAEISGD